MSLSLALSLTSDAWFAVGIVAAWLVIVCLRTLGHELDYAIRCHNLKVEVHTLRLQQIRRMREMGVDKNET